MVDLPGAYSLTPATPDEQVTLEVIEGRRAGEAAPDAIVAVVDATNLRMNLRLVLELQRLGRPMLVALNMADVARSQGLAIDVARARGRTRLPGRRDGRRAARRARPAAGAARAAARQRGARAGRRAAPPARTTLAELQAEVRRILALAAPGAGAVRSAFTPPHRRAW